MALGHAVDDFIIAVKRGALRSDASNAPDRAAAKGAPAAAGARLCGGAPPQQPDLFQAARTGRVSAAGGAAERGDAGARMRPGSPRGGGVIARLAEESPGLVSELGRTGLVLPAVSSWPVQLRSTCEKFEKPADCLQSPLLPALRLYGGGKFLLVGLVVLAFGPGEIRVDDLRQRRGETRITAQGITARSPR